MNHALKRIAPAFAAFLCLASGCGAHDPATTQSVVELPTIDLAIAGRQFKLEVADDFSKRETGLMNRTSMAADHGMLFVFPKDTADPFWMKNTLIPLDIAYIDSGGTVLNIEHMYPKDLTGVQSAGPYRYAIEFNQSIPRNIGLKPGDHVALPALPAK